eukprot:gene11446-13342_t
MASKPCWTSGTVPAHRVLNSYCWMLGNSCAARWLKQISPLRSRNRIRVQQ